jgi:hypothetical protein
MIMRDLENSRQKKRHFGANRILLHSLAAVLLIAIFLPQGAFAFEMISGDLVLINEPVDDMIFGSAGIIEINAPVRGAIIAAGSVYINAPIYGDVSVIAGEVIVNSEIYGNLAVAGGKVMVKGHVDQNAFIVGANILFYPNATVGKDIFVAGGSVKNEGAILGSLTLSSGDLINEGYVGELDIQENAMAARLDMLSNAINILLMSGFLILGIFLLFIFPSSYRGADKEIRKSPLKVTLIGFLMIFASPFVILLFLMSLIGIPLAFILGVSFLISMMAALFFVAYSIGHYMMDLHGIHIGGVWGFILGLLALNLLFRLPYIGGILVLLTLCLGAGSIYYASKKSLAEKKGFKERLIDFFIRSERGVERGIKHDLKEINHEIQKLGNHSKIKS